MLKRTPGKKEPAVKKPGPRPRLQDIEFTLYGWNACMAAFARRPQDIRRVFFSPERSPQMAAVKRWCQAKKLPYRELDAESLNKVAAGTHHEGVVMVVHPMKPQSVHLLTRNPLPADGVVVALDRVADTHNLGAILRSCAFFGAVGMVAGTHEDQAMIAPSAARMAEGALETVPVYASSDLPSALRDFRERGVFIVGTDPVSGSSLYDTNISFPCVLVLGNEKEGLAEKVKNRCNALVQVPARGPMQSLNVSVAAGVILAELDRRKRAQKKPIKK